MTTDMHRLERAARLSMGDFEAAPPSAPAARPWRLTPRLAAPMLLLVLLAVAAALLA